MRYSIFGALSLPVSSSMGSSPDEISSNPAIILNVVDLPQPDGSNENKTINSLSLNLSKKLGSGEKLA